MAWPQEQLPEAQSVHPQKLSGKVTPPWNRVGERDPTHLKHKSKTHTKNTSAKSKNILKWHGPGHGIGIDPWRTAPKMVGEKQGSGREVGRGRE
ncbi:hypothetical protein ACFX10_022270 [Malus domestica]